MKLFANLIAMTIALITAAGTATAENFSFGTLDVGNPWTRATPRGARIAAAYMTITNRGQVSDRLIGGSTSVASRFEIHSMVTEDGVAKMRPVVGGLEVKAGETVSLKPGSFHIMLIGLDKPLEQGARITGTLVFERAGKLDVEFAVASIGQATPPQAKDGHSSQ